MRNYIWFVEERSGRGEWIAWQDAARPTRDRARKLQKAMLREDSDYRLRIRKYVRHAERVR